MPAAHAPCSEVEVRDWYNNHLVTEFNTAMQSMERVGVRLRLLAASLTAMDALEEEFLPVAHLAIAEELRLLANEALPEARKKHPPAG